MDRRFFVVMPGMVQATEGMLFISDSYRRPTASRQHAALIAKDILSKNPECGKLYVAELVLVVEFEEPAPPPIVVRDLKGDK